MILEILTWIIGIIQLAIVVLFCLVLAALICVAVPFLLAGGILVIIICAVANKLLED